MKTQTAILGGVALGVVVLAYLAKDAVAAAANKVNPASDQNVIYDDVIGGVGRSVSGDSNWSLGGWLYDVTHPNQPDPTAPTPLQPQTGASGSWAEKTWSSIMGGGA